MTKVGLLSDTHAYWDEKYLQYFETCDEIWHAGDIGSLEVARKLAEFRAGYPAALSAGITFYGRRSGSIDEAYRWISR